MRESDGLNQPNARDFAHTPTLHLGCEKSCFCFPACLTTAFPGTQEQFVQQVHEQVLTMQLTSKTLSQEWPDLKTSPPKVGFLAFSSQLRIRLY